MPKKTFFTIDEMIDSSKRTQVSFMQYLIAEDNKEPQTSRLYQDYLTEKDQFAEISEAYKNGRVLVPNESRAHELRLGDLAAEKTLHMTDEGLLRNLYKTAKDLRLVDKLLV